MLLFMVIFIIVLLLLQIVNMLHSDWLVNSRYEISEKTYIKSLILSASLHDVNSSLNMLVGNVELLRKNGIARRDLTIDMIKQAINTHKDIFGIDLVYEPNMFDGRDDEYRGDPVYLDKGVFMPYVWRDSYGLTVEWAYKEDDRAWYDEIKSNPHVFWSDPKEYDIGGKKQKVMSLFMPIMENGRFIGVGAADYEVKHFEGFLRTNAINNTNSFILTSSGEEVACDIQINADYNKDFLKKQGVLDKVLKNAAVGAGGVEYINLDFWTNLMVMAYPAGANASESNLVVCYVAHQPSVLNFFINSNVSARNYIIAILCFLVAIPIIMRTLMHYNLDPLTQIYTREMIKRQLPQDLKNARSSCEPLSIIMADLDHFKNVNDTYGHPMGDIVLKEFVAILQRNVRKNDWIARYGGEEFLLCFRGAPRERCMEIAERIRKQVEDMIFTDDDVEVSVTVSMGVASVSGAQKISAQELVAEADKNLYTAKNAGRNKVIG